MANTVFRSVKVVVENATNETLTVQGVATLKGSWVDKLTPKQGDEVPEQSAISWATESAVLGTGTSAFVRLGSIRGYTKLSWNLPWVGEFRFEHDAPDGLRIQHQIDVRQPDAVVVEVTFHDHHHRDADKK